MQIKELTLQTGNLQETKQFYTQILELPLLSETDKSISLKAGTTILHFKSTLEASPFYHFAFTIADNLLEESLQFIKSKGLEILLYEGNMFVDYPNWHARSFYFYDNNRSILEFIVRYELNYQHIAPYNAGAIAEISEIGIVTDDVKNTVNKLKNDHHIQYFKKGPVLDDFVAMGDDHGLLLVCATGRGWVPTGERAVKYPVDIISTEGHRVNI